MRAPYRLGIDIGTNSLGWCVLDLDKSAEPRGIRRIGVRIFSDGRDPQSGTSLAVDRRIPRQQRRRRDRYLDRRQDLMTALVKYGLMPTDPEERKKLVPLDPYELRARGLDGSLTLHELGRALFHLDQRRGFKSNRKTDKAQKPDEIRGMKGGIDKLRTAMTDAGARTLGEYLYVAFRKDRSVRGSKDGTIKPHAPVRARPHTVKGKNEYDLYADRAMYESEFDALWAAQARFHPELTQAARDEIRDIIFYQRPLKPVDPGKCTLDPTDQRAPEALPLVQRFRMLQELANLEIVYPDQTHRPLSQDERDRVLAKLERTKELSFAGMIRLLGLDSDVRFNLESERRKGLKGDQTGIRLAKKDCFGPAWWTPPLSERQNAIVETLLAEESETRLIEIATADWGLDAASARAVVDTPLPEGYARLGRRALSEIVPRLQAKGFGGYRYSDAVKDAGYHHSDFRTGEIVPALPYYGEALERHVAWGTGEPGDPIEKRYGKIANPTVHIGLNQLRKVINALIEDYGHPEEIVVELARELKLGKQDKDRIAKEQAENQEKNEKRRAKLAEIGERDNGENLMRMRMWEELNPEEPHNRRCPYTGEMIPIHRLFSPEVEIEHILPFTHTLDNSPANKTVSLRRANRDKGNRSPFEAFGHNPPGYKWEEILLRASAFPKNKRWRFAADAMERFEKDERGFLDRQLVDTQYLSRITREYLTGICDPNKVRVIPGRLTEMLRGKWGLNKLLSDHNLKNRYDHRHHAIDAFVVGVTDAGLLNRIARAADQARERLIDDMPEPWDGFRDTLDARLRKLVVSHKPDHGTTGKLHEETAYGIVSDPTRAEGATLVSRKPIEALTENEIGRIRDSVLRGQVQAATANLNGEKTALKKALADFSAKSGVRRVRLLKKEEGFIAVTASNGRQYKAYVPGDNHHIDIYALPDGTWAGEAVTVFDANRPSHVPHWQQMHPDARLVMRVHKGDLLRLDHDGWLQVMRVVRLNAKANRLYLAPHNESGDLQKRHDDQGDPFRWLLASYSRLNELGARQVTVDTLGRVRDPGPPK
jgi:CRISPR-associated endonuclease Csn1